MKNHFEQFKKDYQRDILARLVVNLKRGLIREEDARNMSYDILEAFEKTNVNEIFENLVIATRISPPMLDVFIARGREYDERVMQDRVEEIREYVKGGVN